MYYSGTKEAIKEALGELMLHSIEDGGKLRTVDLIKVIRAYYSVGLVEGNDYVKWFIASTGDSLNSVTFRELSQFISIADKIFIQKSMNLME